MKKIINNMLKPLGYRFARTVDRHQAVKYKWLEDFNIKTVIDIGANEGQFAMEIHGFLPHAEIYSFEPLKDTFEILSKVASAHKSIHPFHTALGDYTGKSKIYKNEFSPSSSILELGDKHLEAYPEYNKVSFEEINVQPLDEFVRGKNLKFEDNILLKLDVQGFEDKVIKGSRETLRNVKIVFVEVSFWEMYKTQPLFEDIYSLLKEAGFKYRGNYDVAYNKINGLPIFADGVFIRETTD